MENQTSRKEAIKVSEYIKTWQSENPFEGFKNLDESDAKFKKDFNAFLNSGEFSESTKQLFSIN